MINPIPCEHVLFSVYEIKRAVKKKNGKLIGGVNKQSNFMW
jgi:hypothetical protein